MGKRALFTRPKLERALAHAVLKLMQRDGNGVVPMDDSRMAVPT